MGLFTDGFKLLKKASEPLYKTPKSIQETIEIMAVAENGIFEVSRNKYSKCYRFQDINYTTATEDEQIGIFERYCKFLNSLDCNYKITINNKNKNMEDLRDKVLITEKNDGFNNYRRIYNDIIEEKIIEGRQGIEQERYLTITIERKNFEEAKAQFATLEATIHKAFIELGAEIVPLKGNERLKVLYDYYHLGDEGSFDFDIKKAKKVGADFKNDLCNGMVKYFPDHFEDESKYCKALFIKKYPSSLSDRFINEITSLPVHSITSIDVVPVPKDLTTTERNMLMTLEDYKKFVAIDDMSELADQMLLLGRTLAEGFTEYYRAANVTVFAKFCRDDVELGRFLQGYYNDSKKFYFDKATSSPECITKMDEIGMTDRGWIDDFILHYEKCDRTFERGQTFHNFNDHDYMVLEALSPRNLVVMDMKSGSLTIALGATEYKRYPKDEEPTKDGTGRGNRRKNC